MWFKNLRLYRLTEPFTLSPEELHERLVPAAFQPCLSLQAFSYGWTPPLGRYGSELCHAAGGYLMICTRREDKIVPPAVIRDMVGERVAAIEEEQGREVPRREREAMRDEVLHAVLPTALIRRSLVHAYIAPREGWLVMNTANAKIAEQLLALFSRSLDQPLPTALTVRHDPAATMTKWLSGQQGHKDLRFNDECELRDGDRSGAVVRCRRQDLFADEVRGHLRAGKRAAQVSLTWRERLSCVLSEDLSVKRLRFEDIVQDHTGHGRGHDAATQFDADFALMTLELAEFIPQLLALFGGEGGTRESDARAGVAA